MRLKPRVCVSCITEAVKTGIRENAPLPSRNDVQLVDDLVHRVIPERFGLGEQ